MTEPVADSNAAEGTAADAAPRPRVRPRGARQGGAQSRPNIADIAALANVSTSAVSYALNGRDGVAESTRKRILDIAASLNWRPNSAARALITERASAVGLVSLYSSEHPVLSSEFTGRFLVGLQHELREHDVLLTMHMVDDFTSENQVYQRWLGERRVDGVFILNPIVGDPRLPALEKLGMPAVVIGDVRRKSSIFSAWTDDVDAIDLAVDHLVRLGHQRIARIAGDPRYQHVAIRSRAFDKALAARGLERDRRVDRDLASPDQIVAAINDKLEPLTAILVEEGESVVHLLEALISRGVRVPEDVSILTWDDGAKTTLVRPRLTVLRRDIEEYGRIAARSLIEVIGGTRARSARGTHTELVARESTGFAPSK